MEMIDDRTQWILVGVFIFTLFFLLIRELFLVRRIPSGHPSRGLAIFDVCILFLFTVASLIGVLYLWNIEQAAKSYFDVYPTARYALERYPTSATGDLIFMTSDTTVDIVRYYTQEAKRHGGAFAKTEDGGMTRLAIGLTNAAQFLTIVDEGDQRALHFSKMGNITTISVPN